MQVVLDFHPECSTKRPIDAQVQSSFIGITTSTDFPYAVARHTFLSGMLDSFLAEMSNNGEQLLDATPISPSTVAPNGSAATSTLTTATNVAMTPLHAP